MSLPALLTSALTTAAAIAALAAPAGPPAEAPPGPAAGPPDRVGAAWAWPLDPPVTVARHFDPPEEPWLAGHRGVDLLATDGDARVLSPSDGQIRFAGEVAGRRVLVVEHAGGLRSTFEPVASGLPVGTRVGRGEALGVLTPEQGHCAPRVCLHWGVLRGDAYLDPLALVHLRAVRLLPLG